MKQQQDNKGKFMSKLQLHFFRKNDDLRDQVSRWLSHEEAAQGNELIAIVDAHRKNIEQSFKVPSDLLMSVEHCAEPKKPKRKPAPTDKNYLGQQRGPNGRFLSKKSAPIIDKVTIEETSIAAEPEIKEPPESFSKVAILAGNYVKSIDHSTDAKYTANDIREALIWGLNNHGGTMLPSKKAALYMRDKGIV